MIVVSFLEARYCSREFPAQFVLLLFHRGCSALRSQAMIVLRGESKIELTEVSSLLVGFL